MDNEELLNRYYDAWNRCNVTALLELLHSGAALYDAFWRESCVGRDLEQYLLDIMDDEIFWYERVGDLIVTGNAVVSRYAAHERDGPDIGPVLHEGAEVLTFRDGKILTVTDYYCDFRAGSLEEIAQLAIKRHGESTYATSGLGALRSLHFRSELSNLMTIDKMYLDSTLTVAELAGQIGCTVDQLFRLINAEYGTDFEEYVERQRVNFAKDLLVKYSDDPNWISRVATESGFESAHVFRLAFKKLLGISPENFSSRTNH